MLGPGRGGYPMGVMMSHYFDIPHGFEWQTRDGKVQNPDTLNNILLNTMVKELIADDINDTGNYT